MVLIHFILKLKIFNKMEEVPEVARVIKQEKMLNCDKNVNHIIKFGCCMYVNEKFRFNPRGPQLNAKVVDNKIIVNITIRLTMEVIPSVRGTISMISHDKSFQIIVNICDFWLDNNKFIFKPFGLIYTVMTGSIINGRDQFCFQSFDNKVRIYGGCCTYYIDSVHFWNALVEGTRFHKLSSKRIEEVFGKEYVVYQGKLFPWHIWFEDKTIELPLSLTKVTVDSTGEKIITSLDGKLYKLKVNLGYNRRYLLSQRLITNDAATRERINKDIIAFDKLENVKSLDDLSKFETMVKSNFLFYRTIREMGWYRHFHCYVYVLSLSKIENRYKIGYSTQSLAEFKKSYERSVPNAEIVALFEGHIILEHVLLNNHTLRDSRISHATRPSEVIERPLDDILAALSFYTETKICKLKNPIDVRNINASNEHKYLISLYNGDLLTSIDSKDDNKNIPVPVSFSRDMETIILDIIKGEIKFKLYNKDKLSSLLNRLNIIYRDSMSSGEVEDLILEYINTYINTDKKLPLQFW